MGAFFILLLLLTSVRFIFSSKMMWNKLNIASDLDISYLEGAFDQLYVGVEFYFESLVVGLWYRGLPKIKNALPNNEVLIGLVGFSFVNGLDIGYSYGFTISKLGWGNTGGAHEHLHEVSFYNTGAA